MRELKDMLAQAIAHANQFEPQLDKRRAAVLFWLKIEVQEARKAHDYKSALTAMTLIRLITSEPTLAPIWKALVAASCEAAADATPSSNRGVAHSERVEKVTQHPRVTSNEPVSERRVAHDQAQFDTLQGYIGGVDGRRRF